MLLRRITFVVLLAASAAVLLLSLYLLWNARQWDYLPFIDHPSTTLDARAQLLNDKIDIYNHQIEDLARLVAFLLVLSGLYVIAFALSSHFAAEKYKSLCAQAVETVHREFAMLVGDLREIQENAERAVERAAVDSGRVEELLRQHVPGIPAAVVSPLDITAAVERLRAQVERAHHTGRSASFEISDCEHALAALAMLAGPPQMALLAPVYRDLAIHHDRREPGRARFYRERANALAPGIAPEPAHEPPVPVAAERPARIVVDPLDSARAKYNQAILSRSAGQLDDAGDLLCVALNLARGDAAFSAEIRYELACTQALLGPGHFEEAMEYLRQAFRGKTPAIEKRISQDIDEGGPLQALAAQPPFDKAVNDLLLDVSVS